MKGVCAVREYRPRVADKILARKQEGKGAVLIEGPKWCGKTTTAEQVAGTDFSHRTKVREVLHTGTSGFLTLPMAHQRRPMAGCYGTYGITFECKHPSGTEAANYIAVRADFRVPGQTFTACADLSTQGGSPPPLYSYG